jgi:hypothetical protein
MTTIRWNSRNDWRSYFARDLPRDHRGERHDSSRLRDFWCANAKVRGLLDEVHASAIRVRPTPAALGGLATIREYPLGPTRHDSESGRLLAKLPLWVVTGSQQTAIYSN